MIPEGRVYGQGRADGPASADGQGRRAALAALAFAVTAMAIYGLFASGFGRIRPPARPVEPAAAAQGPPAPAPSARPAPAEPAPAAPVLAVIADGFYLTYLPPDLRRTGGGTLGPGAGGWARYAPEKPEAAGPGRYVEARVERGPVAADWSRYRSHVAVLNARDTLLRGRPAVVGRDPRGGRTIAWLERPGTGLRVRAGESLGKELLAVAASVKAPVGD
ncbi:hypothetical protein Nocox_04120 [Nonomuraea coxensis DSM 45129]|uniref:Secreted protein n=1 Tax=Nonomuraea coxensis DSM 45129 TaxID=1122611 RepID=A0ABX8TSK3_9ACTN|nr:hypothetical protein [Nonomuraea coxensis]QYC38452.1 hypothetical protein Nocox_04120 [Nonomuraea coxensis DSM 45129]